LRIDTALVALLDRRSAGLVHDSVGDDAARRHRHERFLATRLVAGAGVLACLPPYLLWRGVPSLVEAVAAGCLFLPICAAALLSRTGRLPLAHAVSATGLAGLVACLAALSGGLGSAVLVWMAVIPLEAVLSGSRRATFATCAAVAAAILALALGAPQGVAGAGLPLSPLVAMPVFALGAVAHLLAQALQHQRHEAACRAGRRDAERRANLLLSAIDDLVSWHDLNGRVVEASPSASRLTGAPAEALRGHGLMQRVNVADRPAYLQAISGVAASGQPATVSLRLQVEPGTRGEAAALVHVEMRAHRVEGAGEARVVAVTRDVSERHHRAEELERARAEAERADEVKSRFLANVSHELRTPLNAIIGFSQLLAGEGAMAIGPERAREYAGIIGESGQHLLEVVNTLLDMSRIQSGNFEYAPETVDAAALVRACCDLMRLKAEAAGVRLVRPLDERPVEIVADPRACRQVLINLVSNAVKFTPAGGQVEVSLRRTRTGLDIVVADTGAGIGEADLARVGTPFFQAGGGYARTQEGTGLGLSVVRGLIGLHGGAIAFESGAGAGTTVTVSLPAEARTADAPAAPAPITTAVRHAPARVERLARRPLGLFDADPIPVRPASEAGGPVPAALLRAG